MPKKSVLIAILLALFYVVPSSAQSPAFDVASVKAAADPGRVPMFCIIPCTPGERMTVEGGRVDIRFMPLTKLIVTAYRIKPYQLAGPDWMRNERFDIMAKLPEGASKDQIPEMLQALLADRFKLAIRRDKKELPVYALVVAKSGFKLKETTAVAEKVYPASPKDQPLYSGQGDARRLEDGTLVLTGGVLGPLTLIPREDRVAKIDMPKITIAGLIELVAPHQDRPVVDRTELKGTYEFELVLEPPTPPAGGGGGRKDGSPPPADAPPPRDFIADAIFANLEKAGLKFEKSTAPVDQIVVDRVEKAPTGN